MEDANPRQSKPKSKWENFCRCVRPHRDAFIQLVFTAVFSLLPSLCGFSLLKLFGRWTGDWAKLMRNGDLLVASAALMATSLATFRTAENPNGFWRSLSGFGATVILVFSTMVYAGLSLTEHGIVPPDIDIIPHTLVLMSVTIYVGALIVGYHAYLLDQQRVPSNIEIRNRQVSDLNDKLNQL